MGADEIDISDLINAIMDVSVNIGDGKDKPIFNETVQTGASNRYSGGNATKQTPNSNTVPRDDYLALQ